MKINLRGPKNKTERMVAALNSTDKDLFIGEETDHIIVTGKNLEGEVIYLGEFSKSVFMQKNGLCIRDAAEHVKFGRHDNDDTPKETQETCLRKDTNKGK